MTAPNSTDGWVEWSGGECPVGRSDRVIVKFSSGDVWGLPGDGSTYEARTYDWGHGNTGSDIIAYRVVTL